jgi:hypothetical protein
MAGFSSNEPSGPIEGPGKGAGENSFEVKEDKGASPAPSEERDYLSDLKARIRGDRPSPLPKTSPKEKGVGRPSMFHQGSFGAAQTRKVVFGMGKDHGWKDYKWVANPLVRKEMKGFDERFFKGKTFVTKRDKDLIINRLNREIPYYLGAKKLAAEQWREKLKNL